MTDCNETRFRILLVNGPNLNLLGLREPGIYGATTLAGIEEACRARADSLALHLEWFQSNHEGAILDRIAESGLAADLIVINPAALTHTSIALRDALLAVGKPVIEVHLSNVFRREPFRHHSFVSDIAVGLIAGFGKQGYILALEVASAHLREARRTQQEGGQ